MVLREQMNFTTNKSNFKLIESINVDQLNAGTVDFTLQEKFSKGTYGIEIEYNLDSTEDVAMLISVKRDDESELIRTYPKIQKNSGHKVISYFKISKDMKLQLKVSLISLKQIESAIYIPKPNIRVLKVQTLKDFVDEVYVVNLDKRPDRLANFDRQAKALNFTYKRFSAVDGRDPKLYMSWLKYAQKGLVTSEDRKLARKAIQSSGALAYLETYIQIIEEAKSKKYEKIALFDDDSLFHKDFNFYFSEFLQEIPKQHFDLYLLGQVDWPHKPKKEHSVFKSPNQSGSGSWAIILHKNSFDPFLNLLRERNSPVDGIPLRQFFNPNQAIVATKDLVIANVSDSDIRGERDDQAFLKRQGWDFRKHFQLSNSEDFNFETIHKQGFIQNKVRCLGVVTKGRLDYLEELLDTWNTTRDKDSFWCIYIVNSGDDPKDHNAIKSLIEKKIFQNVIIKLAYSFNGSITKNSNIIFEEFKEDVWSEETILFMVNDDITFLQEGWDNLYSEVVENTTYKHLVFFDTSWGKPLKHESMSLEGFELESRTEALKCQGAFYTVTKEVLNQVGIFNERLFPTRGGGHINFTYRCAVNEFNDIEKLWDIKDSNSYIKLQSRDNYKPSSNHLAYNHQVTINSDKFIDNFQKRIKNVSFV